MLKVQLIGYLGRDPEMRYLPSGTPVTNFSVAVNERWTGSDGEKKERTHWVRVAAFGRLGEVANQYLKKGRQVYVEGTLISDDETGGPKVYQRNDGTSGASHEVRAASIEFLGKGDGSQGGAELEEEFDAENIPL